MAEEDKMIKMEVDYSEIVATAVPECETLALEKKLNEALERLFTLEKQTRGAGDAISNSKVLVCVVNICYTCGDWVLLKEHIVTLCKRRGHFKLAITKMIQRCCEMVPETNDLEKKLELIDTLRTITEGKIYVENERARITSILAKIHEKDGELEKAAKILQELQVETFGSMEKAEKVEFILEQMRLCFETKDFVRTSIISKKISTKYFEGKDTEALKMRYYRQMIQLNLHHDEYLAVCKNYYQIYDTDCIKDTEDKWQDPLKNVVVYLVLSEYNNEQVDMMARIKDDSNLAKIPLYKELLTCFNTSELMKWCVVKQVYGDPLRSGTADCPPTGVFPVGDNKCWEVFQRRVVEHNIRVLAKYYTRISLQRFTQLLDLDLKEAEKRLCDQVVKGTVCAKIDRLDGVVSFTKQKSTEEVLNSWSGNLNAVMTLIGNSNHLITKEKMVHQMA